MRSARHADFLLLAFETWVRRQPDDPSLWRSLGIKRKVTQWLRGGDGDLSPLRRDDFKTGAH
jgi:hypothetical protein